MRTAKDIIEEYKARGYNMERLRALADSRDEPLRSEMLTLLMEDALSAGEEDMVFFVADAEGGDREGEAIDFDVLSSLGREGCETDEPISAAPEAADDADAEAYEEVGEIVFDAAPSDAGDCDVAEVLADAEESIAEITIGDDDGAAFIQFDADGHETGVYDYLPGTRLVHRDETNAGVEESGDTPELRVESTSGEAAEPADISSDRADSALHLALQTQNLPNDAENGESDSSAQAESYPVLQSDALVAADPAEERRLEAKAEKRRRRAERRRAKKNKLAHADQCVDAAANRLPEIVLSASEGTETLTEESCREPQAPNARAEEQDLMETAEPFEVPEIQEALVVGEAPEAIEAESRWDYPMIPASANMDMTMAERKAMEETTETEDEVRSEPDFAMASTAEAEISDSDEEANVIRLFAGVEDCPEAGDAEEDGGFAGALLMLPNSLEDAEENAADAAAGAELSPMARIGLVRALLGDPSGYEPQEAEANRDGAEHVIIEAAMSPSPEYDAEYVGRLEEDFQERLDAFSGGLLDLQNKLTESENALREKTNALAEKEAALRDAESRLETGENAMRDMTARMAGLTDDIAEKKRAVEKYADMQKEHKRLYNEFEDLRKAYNEIVTDVMPTLQNERDELILTVERQNEDEEGLRTALKSSGRKIAVGYSLAAAAAIMMVTLPLMHWLRSDESKQNLAMGRQQVGELQQRLEKAETRNVDAEKIIFDLERQTNLAKIELAKLEKANRELSELSNHSTRELASLRANLAGGSASARTVMAAGDNLSMSGPDSGPLRVNEVRDPGGSINNVLAENRERYAREDAVMASTRNRGAGGLQISAVASTQSRQPQAPAVQKKETSPAAPQAAAGGQVAVVKSGEGVAQVVYRVLGTRDPEVIAWVIRENNIKKDRRGNPRIYPEQKLTLPAASGMVASTGGSRR